MTKRPFRGVMPALITPFSSEGEVDAPKLRKFVEFLVPQVHGLYVAGSYGSGPLMPSAQRQLVAETVCDVAKGRVPIIVHVGAPDTQMTIELAKHAESLKVDAVASLTPYYYLHSIELVSEHFRRLIDSVELPVFLYNNPKYTNFCTNPEQMAELAEYGLAGLKDSSANIQLFYDIVAAVDAPAFTFLVGSQTVLLPGLVGGGHGCVSGLSNLFPKLVNRIFEGANTGNFEEALEFQREANELRKLTGAGIPIPFYHVALRLRGIDIGYPKAPLLPLSAQDEKRIAEAMEKYKHWE